MEYQKITNLLGNIPDKKPRFITKKWMEVYDQSGRAYSTNKQVRFKTQMLRSDLCDYNDAYIVFTGKITVTDPNNDAYDKKLALKNNAPSISCISKINGVIIENAEDLDVVILCTIYLNTAKTIEKQQDHYGIIIETNQIVVLIIIIIIIITKMIIIIITIIIIIETE